MKKTSLSLAVLLLASLFIFFKKSAKSSVKDNRPNIVLTMADDLGFSDVGCYRSKIHTPNIDYLAAHVIKKMIANIPTNYPSWLVLLDSNQHSV